MFIFITHCPQILNSNVYKVIDNTGGIFTIPTK